MKHLMLRGLVVGPVSTNCYFLKNKDTDEILIVDPGAEPDRIIRAVEQLSGHPAGILLTHGHYDHMCAVNELRSHYEIPVYAAKAEEHLLLDTTENLSASWSGNPYTVKADVYLEHGEVFKLAGFSVKTLVTPGHTEGSCCYWIEEEGVCLYFILRKLWKNGSAYRKHEQYAKKSERAAGNPAGTYRNLSGTWRGNRCSL